MVVGKGDRSRWLNFSETRQEDLENHNDKYNSDSLLFYQTRVQYYPNSIRRLVM